VVRSIAGLIALAGGITLSFVSSAATGDNAAGVSVGTVFTLVLAVGLLSPVLIRIAAAVFGVIVRPLGVASQLAAANTAASARRLASVLGALVLAVGLGGSLWFVQTSEEHVAARQINAGLLADYVVTTPGGADVTTAIRQTPGVDSAMNIVRSTMFTPSGGITDFTAQGIDAAAQTLNLGVTSGTLADLRSDTIAIDTLAARSLHLHVGSEFQGWFGDGAPAQLRVVAIYARGLGFGQLTVPRNVLVQHTTSALDDAVFVSIAANRPQVVAAVRAELGRIAPGAALVPRADYRSALNQDLVENGWTNQVITAVLLVYVVIGATNTLVIYTLARRRELAILRLAGTTRRQLRAMIGLEQVLLIALALVVGVAIAAATLIPMVKGLTGSASPYIPPMGWLAVIGGVVLLAGVTSALPARRILRLRPVEAIGARE
jgi:putative ABC transport system permease protein